MKNAKSISVLTVIFTLGGQTQDLRLTIWVDPPKSVESQPVWVNLGLMNTTNATQEVQPLVLTDDRSRGVQFQLNYKNGEKIPQSIEGVMDIFGTPKMRNIPPRDSIIQMFNLLNFFSTSGDVNAPPYLSTMHYLKAGTYSLQAKQFTGDETLHSNTIEFSVINPTGDESEALRLLKEADLQYFQNPHDNATIRSYELFLNQFPRSLYAPVAFKSLIFLYLWPQQNKHKALETVASLAEQFPNNPTALHELSIYTPRLKKEGKIDILEKLAQEYPQTRVGAFSRRKLQEERQQR